MGFSGMAEVLRCLVTG